MSPPGTVRTSSSPFPRSRKTQRGRLRHLEPQPFQRFIFKDIGHQSGGSPHLEDPSDAALPQGDLGENRNRNPWSGKEKIMSKVSDIRESIDKKLDRWEASAGAFEAQLQESRDQALARLEARKKILAEALEKIKTEAAKDKGIAEDKKMEIQAHCEHLQVQLALGKAEAKEAFESQTKKIRHSMATLEATLDRCLEAVGHAAGESLQKAIGKLVTAAMEYEAEAEALEARLAMKKTEAKAQLETKRSDLLAQISEFKTRLQGKRNLAREKAAIFEKELSDGISQIKQAFTALFGGGR